MGLKEVASSASGRGRATAMLSVTVLLLFLSLSILPFGGDGTDAYTGGGYLSPRVSSSTEAIWRSGSDNDPTNATVTVTVAGSGTKGITLAPQDVVFLMDHSGSLETYDPQVLRILGAHEYVDNMISPFDRAVIAYFDNVAPSF